jgi:ribonuclease BN (tRNA processing enzyme)
MNVQFVGCGDAFGSGGRFNTCIRVTSSSGDFLIDCGATSMVAMRQLGLSPNAIRTIFISHLHGDHFGGIPFFILDAQFYSRRRTPLTLVGPPGFKDRLIAAMETLFPGSSAAKHKFELGIHEMAPGRPATFCDVSVYAVEVRHACGAPALALRLGCDGKSVAYSGDSEWTEALIEASTGTDPFIVEALSFEKKIPEHLDYSTFRAHVGRVGAKRIVLTHLGPEMLEHSGAAQHEVAYDGMVVEL